MQIEREQSIDDELKQWGIWGRQKQGPSQLRTPGKFVSPSITDARAEEIDRVIAILGVRDSVTVKILKSRYIQEMTVRQMAVEYGYSVAKVDALIKLGIGCVAMGLDVRASNDERF